MQPDNFIYDNIETFTDPPKTCPASIPVVITNAEKDSPSETDLEDLEKAKIKGKDFRLDEDGNSETDPGGASGGNARYYRNRFKKDLLGFGGGSFAPLGSGTRAAHNAQSGLLSVLLLVLSPIVLMTEFDRFRSILWEGFRVLVLYLTKILANFKMGRVVELSPSDWGGNKQAKLGGVAVGPVALFLWCVCIILYFIIDVSVLIDNHCKPHYKKRYEGAVKMMLVLIVFFIITMTLPYLGKIVNIGANEWTNVQSVIVFTLMIGAFITLVVLKYVPTSGNPLFTHCKKGYYAVANNYGEVEDCIKCNQDCKSTGQVGASCVDK